jgi:hypothetical protein
MGMADPFPTEIVLNIGLKLERANSEDELSCWFCHGSKCEWDTVYKIGGQSIGVGVHEHCRESIAKRHPVKPVSELEDFITELEGQLQERAISIVELTKKVEQAKKILNMALSEWYESDWTDHAHDFLGVSRSKSIQEFEAENTALKLENIRLRSLQP